MVKQPQTEIEPTTCFVLMPFTDRFTLYYEEIIKPAITHVGVQPLRGDSLFRPSPIMGDIWQMIQDADVVLAEMTGRNPNVFYELGLSHAIGKPVILLSETIDDVPFDLQSLRVIIYDKNDPSWGDKLRSSITRSLEETLKDSAAAVPAMFRKQVPSQAPEDSEFSMRLSALEGIVAQMTLRGDSSGVPTAEALPLLTTRERDVLSLFAEGLSMQQIAMRLNISVKTVSVHRVRLMEKLGLQSGYELREFAKAAEVVRRKAEAQTGG